MQNTSLKTAKRLQLVEGIYETMFYVGLPKASPRSSREPGWDYDFGCLLAYDASDSGILVSAWNSVNCKPIFWEGGNLYVMILRT